MRISEALAEITSITIGSGYPAVYLTAAEALAGISGAEVVERDDPDRSGKGVFTFYCRPDDVPESLAGTVAVNDKEDGVLFKLERNGSGHLIATEEHLLFGFVSFLLNHLADRDIEHVEGERFFPASFKWHRTAYDFFLNQEGRIQRGMNKATYIRRLAESGFTHVEVNGLAFPRGIETGPEGEIYSMFYTYCPALDQFVDTELNRGLYPGHYLSANLENLKKNADLARRYGLVPGLLSFEPRSVPEAFFERYPMLRGARVDHPFRSFKPRYNMTITHPMVREHYSEMLTRLLEEVPELGFISIWTNDSGSGFEFTKSLYVGRNGGAYLIREWKDDEEIARAAGENAIRFFQVLRDVGCAVNPSFRVMTRMESFYGEHDIIWKGLEERLDVETASLLGRGWEMPYTHPRYSDSNAINAGSIYQSSFDEEETRLIGELEEKSSHPHFYFSAGPNTMFAPLLGIPYPSLTWQRLKMLHEGGVRYLAHLGGTSPPELVPYNVNHEIVSVFQYDPEMEIEAETGRLAATWAGENLASALLEAWRLTEEAILAFPNISTLYSTFGFVWYRLWARPLVPDIEAIPAPERAYYQDFMCTTPHNPNNVDLSRDVLFELMTPENCRRSIERIDSNLWGPLDRAVELLAVNRESATEHLGIGNIIDDQWVRLSALRCWFMTQRNVGAWVAGVHGYLNAERNGDEAGMDSCRALLREMMEKEIENSERLLSLLESGVEFIATTDQEETQLIHGDNLGELLQKRILLMQEHKEDKPYIDQDYIERMAGIILD